MAMSGVAINDECKSAFQDMQLKHQTRYIMFKIENKKTILIAEKADVSKTYDDFLASLPKNEPRYCLVDVEYITKSGADHTKMVFIFWCPDECAVKDKMLYASSKDTIKKTFSGIQCEIQANDFQDIEKAGIQQKLV